MSVTVPVFLSLSLCLWMCFPVSEYIFIHLILGVYVRLLIRVSVSSFVWLFIFVFGYIVTDCTYIVTSLILRFCLSLSLSVSLSFSVSGYIIDNLHVCEQARLGRSVCNSSLVNLCIIINSACIDSYLYLPLWLWRSVTVSGCVITDYMCIYVSW